MVAHFVIDRGGRRRLIRSPHVMFFVQCTHCHHPLHEAPHKLKVGSIINHFCKACDQDTPHKVTKEVKRGS